MKHFRAEFFNSPERGQIDHFADVLISVDATGTVDAVTPTSEVGSLPPDLVDLRDGVLLPGFVDLHVHAPQFPQLGEALDIPLEDWLLRYTFPLEARYADLAFATRVYSALVQTMLSHGTTTAVYFATIHAEASLKLAEICVDLGQRALVGRVAMDHPEGCPDYYRDADAKTSVRETERFIAAVRALPGNGATRVEPAITPRFVPACSDAALAGLGQLARNTGAPVQTHCSESDWEHGHVLNRCGMTDTSALDSFGLLTRRTILAHSNFIGTEDMALIHARGAGIAHCPLSNVYFSNAVFPLRRALEKSLHVGLGTDIAGGPSGFLLDTCRSAIASSRLLEDGVDARLPPDARGVAGSRIDFRDAFWLATSGGAKVLDLPVGRIAPGCQFDATLVRLPEVYSEFGPARSTDDRLQKIIMLAQPADIVATWVAGRRVHGKF